MSYLSTNNSQFQGTEQLTNLTSLSGGAINLTASSTVTVPTVAASDNSTNAASSAFVKSLFSTTTPIVDGTATIGSGNQLAYANHVHPTDTSRAADSNTVHISGTETVTGSKTFGGVTTLAFTNVTAEMDFTLASSSNSAYTVKVSGDTWQRFSLLASGQMYWGPGGTTTTDTTLMRSAPGILQLGSGNQLQVQQDPVNANDVARKSYVDAVALGLSPKPSARLATTAAISIASRTSTTLTTSSSTLTVDGTAVANNDLVLVLNGTSTNTGTSSPDNGLYVISGVGSTVVLTRASSMNTWSQIPGSFVFVEIGTANSGTGWVDINDADSAGTLGTTGITFSKFSSAGAYTAGNGLTLTSNQFSILLNGSGITSGLAISGSGINVAPLGITNAMLAGSISPSKLTASTNGDVLYVTGGAWAEGTPDTANLVDKTSTQSVGGQKTFTSSQTYFMPSTGAESVFVYSGSGGGNASLYVSATSNGNSQIAVTPGTNAANSSNLTLYATTAQTSGIQFTSTSTSAFLYDLGGTATPLSYTYSTKALALAATTVTVPTVATPTDSSTNAASTAFVQSAKRTHTLVSKTASYTATSADDVILVSVTGSSPTITMPSASAVPAGWTLVVKDSGYHAQAYPITVQRAGSDLIDGLTTTVMNTNGTALNLMSDGTSAWWLV